MLKLHRMRSSASLALVLALLLGSLALTPTAGAQVPPIPLDDVQRSRNLHLLSNSPATSPVSQSDLAFWGDLAYVGYYDGFRILDTSVPGNLRQLVDVKCRNNQGDVGVWGDLLFISVDRPVTAPDCNGVDTPAGQTGFEGIRIFDVSDPENTGPDDLIAAVPTDCGSHTHTVVPDLRNDRVLLYVSSSPSFLGPTPYGTDCQQLLPDGSPGHSKISIVEVPLNAPETARVVNEPTFELRDFREESGDQGCHDITIYRALNLAAAACLSEGQLWDITNPEQPVTIQRFFNDAIDIWHSAAFTWDGEIVIWGDEFAGGGGPGCTNPRDDIGRVWFYELNEPKTPIGSYKVPRPQGEQICTMHNFNVIPVRHGYYLVSASNQAGTTVVDFTRPRRPREIAYFDAQTTGGPQISSPWSSYWYNGLIYVNDRGRGVDVLRLVHPATANARRFARLNPQTQGRLLFHPRRGPRNPFVQRLLDR